MMKKIKLNLVFERYPLFYQPYLLPVIEALSGNENIALEISAIKGKKVTSSG